LPASGRHYRRGAGGAPGGPTGGGGGGEPQRSGKPILLDLVGNDRPGIVRDITRLLAEHDVNLESLITEVLPAPMSSEPLFHAEAMLAVPLELSLELLQERLETLADDLMVELNLRTDVQ